MKFILDDQLGLGNDMPNGRKIVMALPACNTAKILALICGENTSQTRHLPELCSRKINRSILSNLVALKTRLLLYLPRLGRAVSKRMPFVQGAVV